MSSAGTYTIVGTVAGFSDTINVQLTVQDEPVSIDTSKLESLIQTIQNTDLSGYTTDSVNALKTKLNEATALLEKENVTQTEIDSMLQELQAAFDGLVKKDTTDPGILEMEIRQLVEIRETILQIKILVEQMELIQGCGWHGIVWRTSWNFCTRCWCSIILKTS